MLEWPGIRTVMLDMDGVLLDLRFDNDFWQEWLPRRYAEARGGQLAEARRSLARRFERRLGTLDWYDTHYWSDALGLDVPALQARFSMLAAGRIRMHPGARSFVRRLRMRGIQPWLVTNAHPETLALKLAATGIDAICAPVVCAHDIGVPKENPAFWPRMAARHPFDASSALFVDDNLAALRSAARYGLRHLRAISRPDSSRARQGTGAFASAASLAELAADLADLPER